MANVFTSLSNTIWYTDKCSISAGNTAVTYQVYATALGSSPAVGNIYSGPPELGAYERKEIYVGVGNYITVTGSNYTAQEIGGQTSAQAGVGNFTEQFIPPPGSAQFNGSTQYLTIPADPALALGTGDFTVETWVYLSSAPGEYAVIDCQGTGQFGCLINSTDIIAFASVAEAYSFTSVVSANVWHHIAFCRVGTTLTCYLDGVSVGTPATSTYNFTSPDTFTIGRNPGANSQYLNGYLSNLRIVKGTAVYTAPFTPPTAPLAAISGTQLLLTTPNDADFLVDSSPNNFTVTNNGEVTSSSLTPF
jgi:hypothetical protein